MQATILKTAFIGLFLGTPFASASLLVEYDIAGASGLSAPAINLAEGITADPLILIGGNGSDAQHTGVVAARNWEVGGTGHLHKYIEFAVTPQLDHPVEYETISFTLFREAGDKNKSGPALWDLYVSTDAFATPGVLLLSEDISGSGDEEPVVFSGQDISALGQQAGTVTFRFVVRDAKPDQGLAGLGNPSGGGDIGSGSNLIIAGTIVAPLPPAAPEPASTVLLGLGSVGLFLYRRRS